MLDLINTISLTFVTDRRVPIGSSDKDEFKYPDLWQGVISSGSVDSLAYPAHPNVNFIFQISFLPFVQNFFPPLGRGVSRITV